MKLNRHTFIQHLERLACSGQVTEVVFTGAFSATALTPDHLLLVEVPGLPAAEPLPQDIGASDLSLLTRAMRLLPGEGNAGAEVDVRVKENRLIIDDGSRGVQRLLTSAPKTIGTRIEEATAEKLFNAVPDVDGIPLTKSVLDGVSAAFALYKASEVEVVVGEDGVKVTVGTEKTHRAEFTLATEVPEGVPECTLLFGQHLIDVFKVLTDFSSAAVTIGGPGKPILISDGDYRYILSPRSRSVDEAKPAVRGKGEKKEKAAKVEEAGEGEADEEAKPVAKSRPKRAAK